MTGIPSVIKSDCGSQFCSELTRQFLALLGCSPCFNVPGRPQQSGLCERLIGTLKNMISKVAIDHPRSWAKYLGYVLWALRECPHETTGLPPWVMVYGKLPRGPLVVLKDKKAQLTLTNPRDAKGCKNCSNSTCLVSFHRIPFPQISNYQCIASRGMLSL